MSTMEDIEKLTKTFAGARTELADRLNRLREEQEVIKRRYLQGIKNAVERCREAHDELHTAIDSSRELFEKPKTRVLHGIKVGMVKQRGKMSIGDDAACVSAIRKLLGDEADAYIKTEETPIRAALANLPAKDLKRLGVEITDDVDAVVIKAADGDIEKLVDALIGNEKLEETVG